MDLITCPVYPMAQAPGVCYVTMFSQRYWPLQLAGIFIICFFIILIIKNNPTIKN